MSGDPAGYVSAALRAHRQRCERNGGTPPRLALDLEAAFSASSGQDRPTFGDPTMPVDSEPVSPRLLDLDTTADALSLSARTVRRLIADGKLRAVHIGGATRVRLADLDEFVAGLTPDSRGVGARPASRPAPRAQLTEVVSSGA